MNAKTGRPKLDNPNTKNLTVRINAELDKKLQSYCAATGTTKGDVVRQGIDLVLAQKEK